MKTTDRKILSHYEDVVDMVCLMLKDRGRNELEAWVVTDAEIRFAMFFGFTEILGELTIDNKRCTPAVWRLVRKF